VARARRAAPAAGRIARRRAREAVARATHRPPAEATTMGRALEAVRTRDLEELFGFFGLEAEPALVSAHRDRIAQRFAAEVREIARRCTGLRERERFTVLREALRLAYGSATWPGAVAAR
jgi:hypothetical protein